MEDVIDEVLLAPNSDEEVKEDGLSIHKNEKKKDTAIIQDQFDNILTTVKATGFVSGKDKSCTDSPKQSSNNVEKESQCDGKKQQYEQFDNQRPGNVKQNTKEKIVRIRIRKLKEKEIDGKCNVDEVIAKHSGE